MKSSAFRKTSIVWIAFVAILFGPLAPSVSHAIAANNTQTASWLEICSADGMRFIQIDGQLADPSAPSEHGLHMEDCPFCLNHAGAHGLPPSNNYTMPVADRADIQPSLFYQSPHPLFIWSAAQSRAPPPLS